MLISFETLFFMSRISDYPLVSTGAESIDINTSVFTKIFEPHPKSLHTHSTSQQANYT